jgi:hypothetical protein
MHELTALVSIRARICHRLQEMPYDVATERQLVRLFGSLGAVERHVAERTCYLVAMLPLDSRPKMFLADDPRRWAFTEEALEAVAHTFAEEIAQLRALLHSACREVHGEAEVQALTARLVAAFIVGEPGSCYTARKRPSGAGA